MTDEEELEITGFISQQLIGYKLGENDRIVAQVFEAVVKLKDGSQCTIYGTHLEGTLSIDWDFTGSKEKPSMDLDRWGIKIQK